MSDIRVDPFTGYNFVIAFVDSSSTLSTVLTGIGSLGQGGFSECSGLELTIELDEHREGGRNDAVLKFPKQGRWTNIRLRRGVARSDDLWNWHYDFLQGKGKRRDGVIILQNESHAPVKVWQFTRGIPVRWLGPSLNALQNQVAIEEIEIAHEGLKIFNTGAEALNTIGNLF